MRFVREDTLDAHLRLVGFSLRISLRISLKISLNISVRIRYLDAHSRLKRF